MQDPRYKIFENGNGKFAIQIKTFFGWDWLKTSGYRGHSSKIRQFDSIQDAREEINKIEFENDRYSKSKQWHIVEER